MGQFRSFKKTIEMYNRMLNDSFRSREECISIYAFKKGLEDNKFVGKSGKYVLVTNGEIIFKFYDDSIDIIEDITDVNNSCIFLIPEPDF